MLVRWYKKCWLGRLNGAAGSDVMTADISGVGCSRLETAASPSDLSPASDQLSSS